MTSEPHKLTADQFSFNNQGDLVINTAEVETLVTAQGRKPTADTSSTTHREAINIAIVITIRDKEPGEATDPE